MQRATYS